MHCIRIQLLIIASIYPVKCLGMSRAFQMRAACTVIKQQNSIAEKYDFVKYDIDICPQKLNFLAKLAGLALLLVNNSF